MGDLDPVALRFGTSRTAHRSASDGRSFIGSPAWFQRLWWWFWGRRLWGGGFTSRPQRQAPGPVIEGSAFEVAPRRRPDKAITRGMRVFHQKFGYGTVRAADGDKLEIDFEQSGIKKVLDSFVVPADQAG